MHPLLVARAARVVDQQADGGRAAGTIDGDGSRGNPGGEGALCTLLVLTVTLELGSFEGPLLIGASRSTARPRPRPRARAPVAGSAAARLGRGVARRPADRRPRLRGRRSRHAVRALPARHRHRLREPRGGALPLPLARSHAYAEGSGSSSPRSISTLKCIARLAASVRSRERSRRDQSSGEAPAGQPGPIPRSNRSGGVALDAEPSPVCEHQA